MIDKSLNYEVADKALELFKKGEIDSSKCIEMILGEERCMEIDIEMQVRDALVALNRS